MTNGEVAAARQEVWVEVLRSSQAKIDIRLEHLEKQMHDIKTLLAEQEASRRTSLAWASAIGGLFGAAATTLVKWWIGRQA